MKVTSFASNTIFKWHPRKSKQSGSMLAKILMCPTLTSTAKLSSRHSDCLMEYSPNTALQDNHPPLRSQLINQHSRSHSNAPQSIQQTSIMICFITPFQTTFPDLKLRQPKSQRLSQSLHLKKKTQWACLSRQLQTPMIFLGIITILILVILPTLGQLSRQAMLSLPKKTTHLEIITLAT